MASLFVHACMDSAPTCPGLGPENVHTCDNTSALEGLQEKQRKSDPGMIPDNTLEASPIKRDLTSH